MGDDIFRYFRYTVKCLCVLKIFCNFPPCFSGSKMPTNYQQSQIILAIKTNDESVLKNLYINNFKKVEKFVLKNNGSSPQAKDLYQEVFLTVWKNIREDKFTPLSDYGFDAYLFQIAKNKWTDYLRSSQYKKTRSLETVISLEPENEVPVNHWEQEAKLKSFSDAFESMGEPCKSLLKDFYYKKKSLREIAQNLNIDEASTRNKKYRCIQKLREIALSPK